MSSQALDTTSGDEMSDDDVLRFTQRNRKNLAVALIKDGVPPTDPKEAAIFLATLDGMDRQAINRKKIASSENVAEADRLMAHAIAKVNNELAASQPFNVDRRSVHIDESSIILGEYEILPGELEVGVSSETFESFVSRMEPDKVPI